MLLEFARGIREAVPYETTLGFVTAAAVIGAFVGAAGGALLAFGVDAKYRADQIVLQLHIECRSSQMPWRFTAGERTYTTWISASGVRLDLWEPPTSADTQMDYFGSKEATPIALECKVTNPGDAALFDVELQLDTAFFSVGASDDIGNFGPRTIVATHIIPVTIPVVEGNQSAKVFVGNLDELFATVDVTQTAQALRAGERRRRDVQIIRRKGLTWNGPVNLVPKSTLMLPKVPPQ